MPVYLHVYLSQLFAIDWKIAKARNLVRTDSKAHTAVEGGEALSTLNPRRDLDGGDQPAGPLRMELSMTSDLDVPNTSPQRYNLLLCKVIELINT